MEPYTDQYFRRPKGAAAQKAGVLKRMRENNEEVEKKVMKLEPSGTEFIDYHIDQLIDAIKAGRLTKKEMVMKIQEKLAERSL